MPYRKILPFVEIMPSILDGITDAFIFIDKNWNFVYLNKHSQSFTPQPIQKLIGKNMLEEFPNLKKTVFYKKYKEAFKTGKVQKFVAEHPFHNKWYDVTAYPSENGLLLSTTPILQNRNWLRKKKTSIKN